ncbi:ankyrin repeat-containing domain protein [Absidia repens]|uniref:Ankyrin repeat-containing domain protein n=1 Tax=Absidia repens TaxID=90262 RepID=A0A1X2I4V0_9FUNG|nr:ankyrin repeat-containing domain protein [Absidia repens]
MSSENSLYIQPSSSQRQQFLVIPPPSPNHGFQQLPTELLIRIFLLAQNPQLRLVTRGFYGISRSALTRAQFLIYRFGRLAALGERSMKSFRMASSLTVVDNLLKLRCNPRADNDWMVWQACEQQNVPLYILLVDAIQPDTRTLERYLNGAAMQGSKAIVDVLVGRYGGSIHHGNDAMMMLACVHHQVDLVQHLITRYACNPHAQQDQYLRRACLSGCEPLVTLFLPGADVHCYNDAPLQNAAHKQHTSVVRLLLDAGANPRANRDASLLSAVRNNDLPTLALLLDAGVDPRCQEDQPLRLACRFGYVAMVDALVSSYGSAATELEADGEHRMNDDVGLESTTGLQENRFVTTIVNCAKGMPLYESLVAGHSAVVTTLLSKGAVTTLEHAQQGLHEAILRNHLACVEVMINAGAILIHPTSYYLAKSKVKEPMRALLRTTSFS